MGAKLPIVTGRQAERAFQKIGFVTLAKRGKGSHMFMRHQRDAVKLTIPDHDPLKKGALRGLIRSAGIEVEEFVRLL